MKIGKVIKTNEKGQIVIPKQYRDALNISSDTALNVVCENQAIYITPIKEVTTDIPSKTSFGDDPMVPSLEELIKDITPQNIHREIDWGKPKGREIW